MRDLRYLVVDDSQIIRNLIVNMIKNSLGATDISQAPDGHKALEMLKSNPVDMVISDWNMPGMNGDELLAAIRSDPTLEKIPFIMITSNGEMKFILRAMELGVTDYVVKPFASPDLEKKLRSAWAASPKRKKKRHASLPHHDAAITIGGKTLPAIIENISLSGALLRVCYSDALGLYKDCVLKLQVKNIGESGIVITSLPAATLRLQGKDPFDPDTGELDPARLSKCMLALCFNSRKIDSGTNDKLHTLIEWLDNRDPEKIDDSLAQQSCCA